MKKLALLGVMLLWLGVCSFSKPMEDTEEPTIPTISVDDELNNGTIEYTVISINEENNYQQVPEEEYKEGDYCFFFIKPDEYFTIKEDTISVGVENTILFDAKEKIKEENEEDYNNWLQESGVDKVYGFALTNANYVLTCDFKVDVAGIINDAKDEIEKTNAANWWNSNIAPFIGGASITTVIVLIFEIIIKATAKSDLKLGTKNLKDSAGEFNDNVGKVMDIVIPLTKTIENSIKSNDENARQARELAKQCRIQAKQLKALTDGFSDIINHDENMVKDGTAKNYNDALDVVAEEEKEDTANEETKSE